MKLPLLIAAAVFVYGASLFAQSTRPSDDTLDWLLNTKATTPSTRPATSQPASQPFIQKDNPEARRGRIVLSNNQTLRGKIATTPEKPIRIYDEKAKEYRDVPLALIKSMEASILWERNQEEWHFKDSGSDIKEFTGKTYPARELLYKVTLVNDQAMTGSIVSPLYLIASDKQQLFVLNKRQKGEVGQTLKDLVYVKRVELE